ncbi:hypothetical protein [Gracilibacillus dipsosauri]|uniref:Uncharacterized protein n=1 Tax=Gracilibacillus dipsosauri TaxID=178340 RepID=A0A317KYA2_9BACI|nr:hypothetical protein [Gracilibacillus dipsosauri]PWU68323.1 hypothetical protein DLJ74_07685 [Gracilibacillus dipsosauri]
MVINITSVNMRYAEGALESVQVHFNGHNEERTININGYIPLTAAQYSGNESVASLQGLVRQEVANKITQDPNAA